MVGLPNIFNLSKDNPNQGEQQQPLDDPREDERLVEMAQARIEDMIGLNMALITPSRLSDSDYHALVSRDLKISNLKEEDVSLLRLWVSTINHLVSDGLDDTARVLHAEMLAFLASKSSVNGFERKALITTLVESRKTHVTESKQGGLLGR